MSRPEPPTEAVVEEWMIRFYNFSALDAAAKSLGPATPYSPWLGEVRMVSQWSTTQVARRMGIRRSDYWKLEKAERTGAIRLKDLIACARALDCDLVYGLRPRDGRLFHRRIIDPLLSRVTKVTPSNLQNMSYDPLVRRELGWSRNSDPAAKFEASRCAQRRANRPNITSIKWPVER